jgi:cell division protein FtsA
METEQQKITTMNNEFVAGLDIGTTKIVCVVGRKNEHGKLEILGLGKAESTGVTRGVVSHITPTVQAIKRAVEECERQSGIEINEVNVGIAGQHIKSLQHRGSLVLKDSDEEIRAEHIDKLIEDMRHLAMLPGEEIIHILPQDFTVDNEHGIKDPIGRVGTRLEANFHIITGQINAIKNIVKCVQKAGLSILGLTLEPLASSEAVLSQEEKEAGVVLVDIGGGTTDIAIFEDEIIRHTAVIPFGGNIITEDIKNGCNIIKKYAEQLKVKFGSALADTTQNNKVVVIPGLHGRPPKEISLKSLAQIIQCRMEEIIELVNLEIKNSSFQNNISAGLVITGGGSNLKHVKQLFEYITGLDTRIGYPHEHLAPGNFSEIESPIYATSVGLVLKGFEIIEKEAYRNNENPVDKKQADQRRRGIDQLMGWLKELFTDDEIN